MENVGVNFWAGRNVFVTGATGLLGSWLVTELVRRRAKVTCLVRDWVPGSLLATNAVLQKTNCVRGELEDYSLLVRALNEYEIDTLFHLGAQTIVGTASRSALSTFESNIRGTWNILEACRTCSRTLERVIVASSDKAYGCHDKLPYAEDAPLQGRYPYDVSKSCADLIAFSYFYTYGLPIAITRCGNLFGGGDLNFSRLIPGTIRSVLYDQPPIIRSNGRYIRDYFYVRDAVQAYLQLAETLPDDDFAGQAFNFGNERPISVLELVQLILNLVQKTELVPIIRDDTNHEIPSQYLDCSKARRMLGWMPAYSLEGALCETIDWYRHYLSEQ